MTSISGTGIPSAPTANAQDSRVKPLDESAKAGAKSNTTAVPAAASTDTAKLSSLAQMLSEAATRAAERDTSNDRKSLATIAARATQPIHSPVFEQTKTARDAELPQSNDPQRLQQARQATAFLDGKGANPFSSLSREQLSLIIHDESGAFTVNERRAALTASDDQHQAWARAVSAQLMDDYNRNGYLSPKALKGILDYYKSLPPIMEAQLPDSYEQDLNTLIAHAESSQSHSKDQLQSLLDLLMAQRAGKASKS